MNDYNSRQEKYSERKVGIPQTAVILVMVLLFGLFPLLPRIAVISGCIAIALLTVLGWIKQWKLVPSLGGFGVVCTAFALLGLPSQLWLAFGLAAYFLIRWFGRVPQDPLRWFSGWAITRQNVVLIILVIFLSAMALIIWALTLRPNINDLIEAFVPRWNLGLLILGGLLFSMVNAAVEEGAYRGVIMDVLDKSIGSGVPSLLTQAAAFGLLHINGLPRGAIGVGLAFIFGILMGLIRRRSGGIFGPWIAHVGADLVVVGLILALSRS